MRRSLFSLGTEEGKGSRAGGGGWGDSREVGIRKFDENRTASNHASGVRGK